MRLIISLLLSLFVLFSSPVTANAAYEDVPLEYLVPYEEVISYAADLIASGLEPSLGVLISAESGNPKASVILEFSGGKDSDGVLDASEFCFGNIVAINAEQTNVECPVVKDYSFEEGTVRLF